MQALLRWSPQLQVVGGHSYLQGLEGLQEQTPQCRHGGSCSMQPLTRAPAPILTGAQITDNT